MACSAPQSPERCDRPGGATSRMFFMRMRRWLAPAVCICFLVAFPLAARSGFLVFVGTQVGVFFLVALGLNFLAGYGGQTSVGHGALVSIGAYVTAIGMVDHGLSFWSVLCLSVVVTAAAGVV